MFPKTEHDLVQPMSLRDKIQFDFFVGVFSISCVCALFMSILLMANEQYLFAFISFVSLTCLIVFSNKKLDALTKKYEEHKKVFQ